MIILSKEKISADQFILINKLDDINNYKFFFFDLNFWIENKSLLKSSNKNFGIEINSDDSLDQIKCDLPFFKLIIINFKTFKDGRPFSMARKLRSSLKFKSEIRAAGHILPDQYIFLLRCGFNSVKIKKEEKDIWLKILENNLGLYYQPKI